MKFLYIVLILASASLARAEQLPAALKMSCRSSFSPIHTSDEDGDLVKVVGKINPNTVVISNEAGKSVMSFGQGKINGQAYEEPSFACNDSASIHPESIDFSYACAAMTVPEPMRFSFTIKLSLQKVEDGIFEGYAQQSSNTQGPILYLWNCKAI